MKIAITSDGEGLEDKVSNMFGRCPYFIIVEIEDGEIKNMESVKNESKNQRGGAGMSAAQLVGDRGVEAVVTGNIGPNAFDVLQKLNIDVYTAKDSIINENIDLFKEGNLQKVTSPTGKPGKGKRRRGRF